MRVLSGAVQRISQHKLSGGLKIGLACVAGAVVLSAARVNAEELLVTNEVWEFRPNSESGGGIWQKGIGEGFRSDAQSITISAGANYGVAAFGGVEAHHLAIVSLTYGHMLGHVVGEGHWYRGNPEFRVELFTGAQFSPDSEWFVGLTPHLRYNFATGTGIGPPDLSGTFEFNLQAGGGVQWFLKPNMALTLDVHYTHWSCAGISEPNKGLNGVTGLLGVAFFF